MRRVRRARRRSRHAAPLSALRCLGEPRHCWINQRRAEASARRITPCCKEFEAGGLAELDAEELAIAIWEDIAAQAQAGGLHDLHHARKQSVLALAKSDQRARPITPAGFCADRARADRQVRGAESVQPSQPSPVRSALCQIPRWPLAGRSDPNMLEPPLGFSVDAMEPVGEAHEIISKATPVIAHPGGALGGEDDVGSVALEGSAEPASPPSPSPAAAHERLAEILPKITIRRRPLK